MRADDSSRTGRRTLPEEVEDGARHLAPRQIASHRAQQGFVVARCRPGIEQRLIEEAVNIVLAALVKLVACGKDERRGLADVQGAHELATIEGSLASFSAADVSDRVRKRGSSATILGIPRA